MSRMDLFVAACSAGAPLLTILAAVVRYLIRILRTIEDVGRTARGVATSYAEHVKASDRIHTRHARQLARLEARADPRGHH